jgi:hypothetical protein
MHTTTEGNMKDWFTHELHPLCTFFPRMSGAEFDALVADIAANGLQNPIVLHDEMVLDGGNRYRACQVANVEPRFVQFSGDSIGQFVLSANLHRRHLSAGQQATIVSSVKDWDKAHTHGGTRRGDQGATLHLETVKDRAAESGASIRTQKMADKVARESPELAKKVAHGEISLPQAAREVSPPKQIPKPAPVVQQVRAPDADELREQISELAAMLDEVRADNESMARVFEADDKVTAALSEAKRYREQLRIVEGRITGLTSEKNEAIRQAKMWQRRCEKLEKSGAVLAA